MGGEITIGDCDAHQSGLRARRAGALGRRQLGVETGQGARADHQHQLVDIGDEVVDGAVGDADLLGQITRLQAGQALRGDRPLGRLDQGFALLGASFQGFRHRSPFL